MILSADLETFGNVGETDSIAQLLNNTELISINQDTLGNQCEELELVNATGNDTLGYYRAMVEDEATGDL